MDVIDLSGYHLIAGLFPATSIPIFTQGGDAAEGDGVGQAFSLYLTYGRLCTLFGTSQSCCAFRFGNIAAVPLVNASRPVPGLAYTLRPARVFPHSLHSYARLYSCLYFYDFLN